MAELVDAPDSKSGHFGGVGSIPSTPTTVLFFIAVNNKNEIPKKIKLKYFYIFLKKHFYLRNILNQKCFLSVYLEIFI